MTAFLSYSRRDQAWVVALEAELNALNISPWIDQRRIPVGTPWLAEIRDGIEVSTLVVACRSRTFDESVHCASELAIADSLGVEVFNVSVDRSPASAAADIAAALEDQPPERVLANELLARARSWDRAGRRRRLLLPRRDIRRLAAAPTPDDERRELVRSFLRRSRRKRIVTVAYVVVAVFALMVVISIPRTLEQFNEDQNVITDELLARQAAATELTMAADADYYTALESSLSLSSTEAAIDAAALSSLLSMRTADDAFRLPDGGPATLEHPVDHAVTFRVGGDAWYERPLQAGTPLVDASPPAPSASPATARIDGGVVEVMVEGQLHRLVSLVRAGASAVVSPDLRMLAVGVDRGVDVYDLDGGTHIGHLVGVGDTTTSVAWTADSTGVWGSAGGWMLHWTVRSGMVLLDESDDQYRAVMPTDDGVWVLEESGRLLLVVDGEIVGEIELPATAYSAAITPDRDRIVSVGSDAVFVTEVAGGSTTQLDLACSLHRPAIARAGAVVALTCGEDLVVLNAAEAAVVETVELPASAQGEPPAFGADGSVWIPGLGGELFRFADGSLSVVADSVFRTCPASWFGAVVSDAGLVHPFGQAVGTIACTGYVDTADGERWQAGALEFDVPHRARASVFGVGGNTVVTGFSNGVIVVWPSTNIVPQVVLTEVSGDIFDLAIDGSAGYAVTRSGMLATFPLPPVPSNAVLGEQARERLAWAREFGLIEESSADELAIADP